MSKKNVFTPILDEFLDMCLQLVHFQHFVHWQLGKTRKQIDESFAKFKKLGRAHHFSTGTALSIVDVFHKGQWVTRFPAGARVTAGTDLQRLVIDMEGRFNAFM